VKYMIKRSLDILAMIMLMTVLMFANTVRSDVVAKGLVAYWSFDASTINGDKVKDTVGQNDGVMKSGPKKVAGKINGALQFDGANSVDIEGTDTLDFVGKEEFSVAVWVKPDNDSPVVGVVAGCCGTIVAQRDALSWALRFDGRNGGQEFEFIVCPNWQGDGGFGAPLKEMPSGEWHYLTGIVAKKNPPNMYLYLDGEKITEGTFSGPMVGNGPETDIGHASDGGFIGAIDEVAIYNRALSEDEVKQNFQSLRFFAVNANYKLAICWGDIKK